MSSRSALQLRRHVREQDRDYSFRVPVAGSRITRCLHVPSGSDQSIWSHGPDIPNPIGEARIQRRVRKAGGQGGRIPDRALQHIQHAGKRAPRSG